VYKLEKRKRVSLADIETKDDNIEVSEELPKTASPVKDAVSVLSEDYDDLAVQQIFSSESSLNETEKKFYLKRRRQYLEDFQINQSSDFTILHQVIMEEIIRERYYKETLENPSKDFSQQMNDATSRLQKSLQQLALGRDQRIKNRETGGVSIADLAKKYYEVKKPEMAETTLKRDQEDKLLAESQDHKLQAELGIIAQTYGEEFLEAVLGGDPTSDAD
jgi:hypothetical protein